jgi:succinate-semialdehyde dehydrogenase/glutarate-semialdehyde dehydrogenase
VTSREVIVVHDPATGQEIARYDAFDEARIEVALARADAQQRLWAAVPLERRREVLRSVADGLRTGREELAALITREMGKPLAEARAEVDKCAWNCDYYADEAAGFLADEQVESSAQTSWVAYEPVGVVLAVMPWNFPFWQVFRFAAPALMAGNGALLKHSPNVTGCALAIERLLVAGGLPVGLFATLLVDEPSVPETTGRLVADPRVAAVTLTGSERAGVALGRAAGAALKKSVLELGGSDPFIVLADAHLASAVDTAVAARFLNAGQSCIAAKRFIVHSAVADEFQDRFARAVAELALGDPTDPATRIGPLARADLRDELHRLVVGSVEQGARIITGGRPLDGPGYFYEPTVLADVTPQMPVFRQETFGPVAAVLRARDDEHTVALANDTRYGLGASVWSTDTEHALAVGRRVQSGSLFVNGMVSSDPRLPFGGTKASGYGRELAVFGIREFTNVRTVWVAAAGYRPAVPAAAE